MERINSLTEVTAIINIKVYEIWSSFYPFLKNIGLVWVSHFFILVV